MSNTTLSVLPVPPATSVTASAGNVTVSGGVLSITTCPDVVFNKMRAINKVVSVAETLQVTTLTPTASSGAVYTFFIRQFDLDNNKWLSLEVSYKATASDNVTTIGDAFRSIIAVAKAAGRIQITGSGTSTTILTAVTRYPIFTVTITSTGGGLTQSTGTPGVRSIGLAADVQLAYSRLGLTAPSGLAAAYTTFTMDFGQNMGNGLGDMLRDQEGVHTMYVSESATNYSALNTRLGELQTAYPSGGTTADPKLIAKPALA